MDMEKYVCPECGYVYDPEVGDPEHGIPAGTAYKDLPSDWHCPYCGVDKESLKSFDSVMGTA
jgi:rubredoxin